MPTGSARRLPDFPWDTLTPHKSTATAHPDGIVDLSVGTPVDPTPNLLREALSAASDAPGYPATHGTPALREAAAGWFARRRGVPDLDPDAVLPTIGSKELVTWLPTLLGLGAGHTVVIPEIAYPSYDVGARLAGCRSSSRTAPPSSARAPSTSCGSTRRPTRPGVCSASTTWRRSWPGPASGAPWWRATSATQSSAGATPGCRASSTPSVCGDSHHGPARGVLAAASSRTWPATARASWPATPPWCKQLLEVRKHAGMIVPAPVQEAMRVALGDDAHVAAQKERYRAPARRAARPRWRSAVCASTPPTPRRVSTCGPRADEDCWDTVVVPRRPRRPGRTRVVLRGRRAAPRAGRADGHGRARRRSRCRGSGG